MRTAAYLSFLLLAASLTGCSPDPTSGNTAPENRRFVPIDPDHAVLWDRQTTETARLLKSIVEEFNGAHDGLDVRVVHTGGYGDIYRKVAASIQAGTLPAMAVAYETMTAEYIRKGAALPLSAYVQDPETGYSDAEWADFFPAVLETNRFSEYDDELYSFPFTKSVLLLYTNRRVLAAAGIDTPPRTWQEFLNASRTIKSELGITPLSLNVSASTLTAIVYSLGGDVVRGSRPHFDSPEVRKAFELLDTLVREGLVYQNQPGTYEDQTSFGQDRVAFNFRPSSNLFYIARLMDDYSTWTVSDIPQLDPAKPANVLYGANICIFRTAPEHQQAAWAFIRHFTSPETTARWAIGTGYLPLRKSAAESPAMQAFFDEQPHHRVPFDILGHARPEPNIAAWQELRGMIENAMVAVLSKMKSGEQAARDLQAEAMASFERRAANEGL